MGSVHCVKLKYSVHHSEGAWWYSSILYHGCHLLQYIRTGTKIVALCRSVKKIISCENIKVEMKHHLSMCACFKALARWLLPIPCGTECCSLWYKHTNTHALSPVLHWQAVIPALAYERQQLEGVAVNVVVVACVIHLDGSSSVLAIPRSLLRYLLSFCVSFCVSVMLLRLTNHMPQGM